MAEGSQVVGLGVVTGAAIRHSWLSLYDAIRTFTTTGIALPRQGNVPGLTGMPSHTQSDFRCAEMKNPGNSRGLGYSILVSKWIYF